MRMDHVERIRKRAETTGTPLCCTRWRQKKNPKISTPNECCCFFFFFLIYVVFVGRLGLLPEKKKERLARKWLQKAAVSLFDAVRCLLSFPLVDSRDGGFCLTPNCFILVLMMIFHDVLMSTCSVRQPGAVNYAAASKYSSRISWTHLFFVFFPKISGYSEDNNTC